MHESPLIRLLRAQADLLAVSPDRLFTMDREAILAGLRAHEDWERSHPRLDEDLQGPDLSKAEAAERLGVSKSTFDALLKAGKVPAAYRRDGGGSWRIPRASIATMQEAERTNGQAASHRRSQTRRDVHAPRVATEMTPPPPTVAESAIASGGSANNARTSVRITTTGDGGTPMPGMTIDVTTSASSGTVPAPLAPHVVVPMAEVPAAAQPPVSRVTGAAPAPAAAARTGSSPRATPLTAPLHRPLDSREAQETMDDWQTLLPTRAPVTKARPPKRKRVTRA